MPPSQAPEPGVEQGASAPIEAGPSPADASARSPSRFPSTASQPFNEQPFNEQPVGIIPAAPADPAWTGCDVVRLIVLTIAALFVGVLVVMLIVRGLLYPHVALGEIARLPLVAIAGQSLGYVLVLAYMYILVTRERDRPDFLAAIHWNWPSNIALYVLAGFALAVALQFLAQFLPIPKGLPIDNFFRTSAEVWALSILSVALAPLMEELFFRGFLYPVLARSFGLPIAVFATALAFALLHGMQLMFSWGPLLVIFLVGLALTVVRARNNSVAACVLVHMAYNGTLAVATFAATDGFRHLERLNSQ
jgi:membrane protease YdiL (CAAX protease family)